MSKMISEAAGQFRMVAGPDEFFDILDKIKPGQFMTFGYVTAAKLDYPKKKILNPATKRMNTVDDYQTFGQNLGVQDNVTGVVKVCIYNMQWQDKKKFSQRYNDFKTTRDSLYDKYGLTRNSARYQTQNNNYGGGVKQYAGDNDDLKLHTYTDANLYDVKPISTTYYLTFENGKIQPIDKSRLPFPAKKEVQTLIQKLQSAGATEEEIAPLKNFDYKRFEHSHILFVSATSDGIPTLYINTRLSDKIGGIVNVDPQQLIQVARERYPKYTSIQECGNLYQVNESFIRDAIREGVLKVLNEMAGDYYRKDDDGEVHTDSKRTYRGIPGTIYIWHGDWADPTVLYKGKEYNATDVDDNLWANYKADCEAEGKEPDENEFDDLPLEWFIENFKEYVYLADGGNY